MKKNLAKTRLEGAIIRQGDVFKVVAQLAASGENAFDLVFADPPYAHKPGDVDLTAKLAADEAFQKLVPRGASVVLESLAIRHQATFSEAWELLRSRDYGSTRIIWLRRR
jgi:16S rRNA (guanine966-N2)-methyltransferase